MNGGVPMMPVTGMPNVMDIAGMQVMQIPILTSGMYDPATGIFNPR